MNLIFDNTYIFSTVEDLAFVHYTFSKQKRLKFSFAAAPQIFQILVQITRL